MDDLVIFGIPGVAVIVALIELAKGYGLPTKWAPLVAIGLGVLLSTLVYLSGINPAVATWVKLILGGILCGLAAVGGYSGVRTLIQKFIVKTP